MPIVNGAPGVELWKQYVIHMMKAKGLRPPYVCGPVPDTPVNRQVMQELNEYYAVLWNVKVFKSKHHKIGLLIDFKPSISHQHDYF